MRHIIRRQPTPAERRAAEAVLRCHQQKYGEYARRKNGETYRMEVDHQIISVEVMNCKASYVATVMNHHRPLSKFAGYRPDVSTHLCRPAVGL